MSPGQTELTKLAEGKGVTLSQLALAWLLARRDCIVPIPGSRNPDRVAGPSPQPT